MTVRKVYLRKIQGALAAELDRCDLRLGQRHRLPRDIALGYGAAHETIRPQVVRGDGKVEKTAVFLCIETDDGITGTAGPLHVPDPAFTFSPLVPLILGQDPFNTSYLWQLMYRSCVDPGPAQMKAISAIDIALWDIKCKAAGLPLYRMLGGKVQPRLPVYASSVATAYHDGDYDLEAVRRYVRAICDQGYVGSKWWIHRGPSDGERGVADMEALVQAVREAGGPEHRIMLDCWCGWTYDYAMRACRRLSPYDVFFLEEPLLPAQTDAAARLSRECPVTISLGEHLLGSYDFLKHLDSGFRGIFQPDPCWCGGITETVRIMGLLTAHDATVCFHGSSTPLSVQIASTFPINHVPMCEYLVNMMEAAQLFLKYPLRPVDGFLAPDDAPGCHMDIDDTKVESEQIVSLAEK